MTTRTNNGKTSRLSTIKNRLRLAFTSGNRQLRFSRQYVAHLKAMVSPSTLRRWKREWAKA